MLFFFHPKTGNISSEGFLWVSFPFFFHLSPNPYHHHPTPHFLLYSQRLQAFYSCHVRYAGRKGVQTMYFGGEEVWRGVAGEMNRGRGVERNCWSLKGINLASSVSSTQHCFQILSRGYLLTLPVCLPVTLSVSIFSSPRDKRKPFFCRGFVLLFQSHWPFATGSHSLYNAPSRCCEQSVTLKIRQETNMSLVLLVHFKGNNYMQLCCPISDATDSSGSGPLR